MKLCSLFCIQTLFIFCLICIVGCISKKQEKQNDRIPVAVSIVPMKYIVEKIGGDHVDVMAMAEPGTSPHSYEPRPAQIARLSHTQLYFSIGVEFEKVWLPRFLETADSLRIVPCDSGITKLSMVSSHDDHNGNCNEPEGSVDENRDNFDPHVWLSPELVKGIVEIIAAQLCLHDSSHCKDYLKNRDYLLMAIKELQDTIRMNLEESNIEQFIVFHPSWGYFAHEFGLKQIPIEIEGKEPVAKELKHVLDIARKNKITTIFVQPQFSQKSAETIASEIEGVVVPIDPLAYKWDTNLLSVANALVGR